MCVDAEQKPVTLACQSRGKCLDFHMLLLRPLAQLLVQHWRRYEDGLNELLGCENKDLQAEKRQHD